MLNSLYPEHQLLYLPNHQIPELAVICHIQPSFVFKDAL